MTSLVVSANLPEIFRDNKFVQIVCESNAITEEQFVHKNDDITKIEMCHNTLLTLESLQPFLYLKELCIVNQPIEIIEHLHEVPHLESLWLAECKLETISGLNHCTNLKGLYLYSNKIARIENINHLTKLEVLWLGDNISKLDGLSSLVNLKSLWVQSNQINSIGSTLENNTKLKELNISSNNISSFRDISAISRLTQLERLWFSDSTFGDNPICHLCNYQTHALSHVRQLVKLDGAPVTDENRKLAESTYTKKKMYYNMKLKTLKRWMGGQLKLAAKHRDDYAQQIYTSILPVRREINLLEKIKDERSNNISRLDDPSELSLVTLESIENKLDALNECLHKQLNLFKELDVKYSEFEAAMRKHQSSDFSRIQQELESDVRLELGSQSDTWVASCVELITSRYFPENPASFPPFIKVARVYRIHNRHLRSLFENAYLNHSDEEGDADSDDEESGKHVEYLFYTDPVEGSETTHMNVDAVLEMGFPSPSEYAERGLSESVPLYNCVNLADANRVLKTTGRTTPSISLPPAKLLIVKSLIGKTTHARFDQIATQNPSKSDYPNMASVFRTRGEDSKQKQWYFFNNVVLLPEYLVEFEYVPTSVTVESSVEDTEETEDSRMMIKFTKECSAIVETANQTNDKAIISREPTIVSHAPVPHITDAWLQSIHPPGVTFSSITYLNISGASLTRLEGLTLLVNLRVSILVAAHNLIRKIEGLTDLKSLERLDLSNNQIKRIEGLKGLPLTALLLHSNYLSRLDDVILLKKYVPELTELDMRNNPVRRARGYKILVLRRLSKLAILDGAVISTEDKAAAQEATPTLTPSFIRQHAYSRRHGGGAMPLTIGEGVETDDWWAKVVVLNLRRCGIRRLTHLEKLVHLRKADLGDNLIGRIDGLDSLKQLEDLSLDENCISRLDGLSKLGHLRKLELSRNQIGSVDGLESLMHLVQLSIEDNMIISLNDLGNNKISDRREIRYLRNLERLVITDLSGNDVDSTESYRLFVINKLRHLKVLDGQVIEGEEQSAAKERFAGRLTSDVLEEKVGHIHYSSVRTLDLSNMKIKEIDPLSGEEFNQLREVTLDHNSLTTTKGLASLASLEVLRLNHNRIENLGLGPDNESDRSYILPKLEILELSRNCVTSLANLQLQSMPNLKVLILTENAITRLEGLEGMSRLQKLVLDKNKIKSVDESTLTVANLPHLSVLNLEQRENYLKISACFSALSNLKVLTLGQNRIADISELDRLVIPKLEELTLTGNAVARKLHYRAHAISSNRTLKMLDGRPVTDEERNKAEYLVSTGVVSSAVVLDRSTETPDPSSPNPPRKVALKPNMIDFGQMLALGTQVRADHNHNDPPDRSGSPTVPKEWSSVPNGKSSSAAKTFKPKVQGRSSAWK